MGKWVSAIDTIAVFLFPLYWYWVMPGLVEAVGQCPRVAILDFGHIVPYKRVILLLIPCLDEPYLGKGVIVEPHTSQWAKLTHWLMKFLLQMSCCPWYLQYWNITVSNLVPLIQCSSKCFWTRLIDLEVHVSLTKFYAGRLQRLLFKRSYWTMLAWTTYAPQRSGFLH